jgi:hypothetical protein
MRTRFVIFILVFSTLHFSLSMLAIFNGFIIFRAPSTASEIFWQCVMNVLLFPANVLLKGTGDNWTQTFAIILNSLVWGIAFATFCFGLRKLYKNRSFSKI